MASVRERLASARDLLRAGHPETSVSTAYYAMLYAARAALSEVNRYARTHRGTWQLFREQFVLTGRFEQPLYQATQDAKREREAGDYDAAGASAQEAERLLGEAERFVEAVAEMHR